MTQAVTLAQLGGADTTLPFRNRIINGDMRIDQRNAGASITPTANAAYSTDRWAGYLSTSSKYSLQQVAVPSPLAGFTSAIKATSLSAYEPTGTNYFAFAQAIEGYNFSDLNFGTANAKPVTISFWAHSSLTGNLGASLQNYAEDRCYSFNATITNANTWTYCTVTIPGCTDGTWNATNSGAAYLWFGLGAAGTRLGTAGTWTTTGGQNLQPTGSLNYVATNGATLYITGVQLETGTVATPFERRPYGMELALCQRYCLVWSYDTSAIRLFGWNNTTTVGVVNLPFPVTVRSPPTSVTVTNAATMTYYASGTSYTVSSIALDSNAGINTANLTITTTGGLTVGAGNILGIQGASQKIVLNGMEL